MIFSSKLNDWKANNDQTSVVCLGNLLIYVPNTLLPHLGFLKIPEVIHGDSCLIECLSDVTPCYSRFFFAIKGSFPDVQPVTVEVTCIAALVSAQTASAGHRNGKDS